jgi:hypothetical protein
MPKNSPIVASLLVLIIAFTFGYDLQSFTPTREVAQVVGAVGVGSEPVFDSSADTMIFQTNFDNYTWNTLHPACNSTVSSPTIVDHAWYYCDTFTTNGQPGYDPDVVTTTGHSGTGVQFHYDGVLQESHGLQTADISTNTGNKMSVVQYWAKITPDPGYVLNETTVAAKIKWIELWHGDPSNSRIEFAIIDHAGCPYYGAGYVNWGVVDQAETLCDGVEPGRPTVGDVADGQWHRFTYLTKPNTSQGSRDGMAVMWVDGTKIIDIEESTVGVVAGDPSNPRISGAVWAHQDDVDALATGYGIQTPEWGGPLTNGTMPFTIAIDDFKWWTINNGSVPTSPSTPPPVVTPPPTTPTVPPPVTTPSVPPAPTTGTTFGNTVNDGGLNENNTGPLECGVFTAPTTGTLASLTQLQNTTGGNWKAVLVNASTKTIVTNGIGNATPTANGWSTSTFSTPPQVTAGTSYALCFVYDSLVYWSETHSGTAGDFFDSTNSYTTPTNPTDGGFNNFTPTVYATYVTPAPTTPTTPSVPPPTTPTTPTGSVPGVPSAPSFSVSSAGNTTSSIFTSWPAASGATSYRYAAGLNSGSSWNGQTGSVVSPQVTLASVPNGSSIYLCVWAENSTGESPDNGCNSYTVPTSTATTPTTPPPTTPTTPPVTPNFSVSSWVSLTQATNVRSSADPSASLLGTQNAGAVGQIVGGPTIAGGYVWYDVNYQNGVDGWSIQDFMQITTAPVTPPTTPTTPSTTLSIGSKVTTTSNLRVRLQATTASKQLGIQRTGATGVIKNGPIQANGYTWWSVDFTTGADGWVAGQYLKAQ